VKQCADNSRLLNVTAMMVCIRGGQSDELMEQHLNRQRWHKLCISELFPYLMAFNFRVPNYSRLVSLTCSSPLFIISFRTAFVVARVCVFVFVCLFVCVCVRERERQQR
jgi:hypothetical protein